MLGIIFTGGLGPEAQAVKRLIETEAAEVIFIAADSGLEAAENAGIKPAWIIGDMDSLSDPARLAAYPSECVIRYKNDQDFTDTEMAFSLALEKGCHEIWIIGGGGGRIDHLFAIRSLFEREFFPCRWITDTADIRCVDAGSRLQAADSGEQAVVVSVFPLGVGPWKAESCGLKWPLDGLSWDRGFFGLSNVAEGEFSIKAVEGRFMVVLSVI